MNPEQLLQHFERISKVPEAIPRLRRFILDLAVRGKLVEQDSGDEPAKELLRQIEGEKARLVKEGEIRKSKAGPPPAELPFDLPRGWEEVTLQAVCRTITDGDHLPPPKADQGVAFLVIGNVRTKKIDFTGCRFVPEKYYNGLDPSRQPKEGDLLYTLVGSYGIPVIVNTGRPFCVQRHIGILRPVQLINVGFLARTMESSVVFDQATECATGIAQKTVPLSGLRKITIPLPPLAEQHRIVAKVDELMILCDQLEVARNEREQRRDQLVAASLHRLSQPDSFAEDEDATDAAERFRQHVRFHLDHLSRLTTRVEHIKALRQTILNLAVRGKLVEQDPNDEPAVELLEKIAVENTRLIQQGEIKRVKSRHPATEPEIPFSPPQNWQWVRIADLLVGDSQNGYSKRPDDAPDGVPILRISAGTVRQDGVVAEEEYKQISGIMPDLREKYLLKPGDLLACRFNGSREFVGRLSIFMDYLGIRPIYPDKLIRLRLHTQFVLPKLIQYFATSSPIRSNIEFYCATTVGNWGISASNMKAVKIPLPPLAEQHRIVAKIGELMVLCDHLESQLNAAQTIDGRLLGAVLYEALKPVLEMAA